MTSLRTILTVMAAAAVLSSGAIGVASAAPSGYCLSDQQIQQEISTGKIQSWPKIKKAAGISAYQEVSDVNVCLENGVPYYQVNVVSPDGEARKIVLNAIDGRN